MCEAGRYDRIEERAPGKLEHLNSIKQIRLLCAGRIGPHPGPGSHTWHLGSGPCGGCFLGTWKRLRSGLVEFLLLLLLLFFFFAF